MHYLTSLIVVIIIGIGSRIFHMGFSFLDKYLGDALYAIMVYLIISILWAGGTPLLKSCAVAVIMVIIETFQLTQIPLLFSRSDNIVLNMIAILLGTVFSWLDLLAYLIGILATSSMDHRMLDNHV